MNTALLRLENINKKFQNVKALNNITTEFYCGDIVSIIGGNGAGKSTLIKVIAGVVPISKGEIYMNERKLNLSSPYNAKKSGIILCPQELQLFNELSILENIFLGNELLEKGMLKDKKNIEQKVKDVLVKLNMNVNIYNKVKDLSMAEKFLIQFARALVCEIKILIVDELFDVLTNIECELVYEILKDLKKKGVVVIFITHKIEMSIKMADSILVMKEGQIVDKIKTKNAEKQKIAKRILGKDCSARFPKLKIKMGEDLLQVKNISNKFLEDINFTLKRGEIIGIAGLVGSGRTSLLKAIVGLNKVDKGEIILMPEYKKNKKKSKFHSNIGFMSEDRDIKGFFPMLSIGQNITIKNIKSVSKYRFILTSEEMILGKDIMDRVGLTSEKFEDNISYLSGGNKQKILVARSIFSRCNIYIFDESTKGVDVAGKVEIYNIINELVRRGAGIILVSSDFSELTGMCDKVIVIKKGSMTAELTGKELNQLKLFSTLEGI